MSGDFPFHIKMLLLVITVSPLPSRGPVTLCSWPLYPQFPCLVLDPFLYLWQRKPFEVSRGLL